MSSYTGVSGAALAMPGPFDYTAGISYMRHKLPCLYGIDLRQQLATAFGWPQNQLRFLSDSVAFLMGELSVGAARGVSRAVGITLGTGIGSAFAINGDIVTAGPGVPPEGDIWNLSYEGGIIEDWVSSRAIQNSYKQLTGATREVVDLARDVESDTAAQEAFAEFGQHLGQALKVSLAEFRPELIVLGGGICRASQLFLPVAENQLKGLNIQLRSTSLFELAALVGAGVAWFNGSNDTALSASALKASGTLPDAG
jgi:glucokinase